MGHGRRGPACARDRTLEGRSIAPNGGACPAVLHTVTTLNGDDHTRLLPPFITETSMRIASFALLACSLAATAPLGAQGPARGGSPVGNPASFLLARTGELKLSDAQVTRLAAIARRADDRRRAIGAQLDSLRPAPGRALRDSAARAERDRVADRMRPALDRLREQEHADLRDAISVLSADQQATAWELVARGPGGGRGAGAPGFGRVSGPGRGRDGFAPGGRGRARPDDRDDARSRRPSPE